MSKIKTQVLMASVALAACAAVSMATPAAAMDWNGFYAGIHGGLTNGESNWADIDVPGFPSQTLSGRFSSNEPNGSVFGAQVGYNHQKDNLVIGVEADLSSGSVDGGNRCFGAYHDYTASCNTSVDWTRDLAVRLGFTPTDGLLVYAKGGISWAGVVYHPNDLDYGDPSIYYKPSDSNRTGRVIGVGADVAVNDHWSVGVEYNTRNFGAEKVKFLPGPTTNFLNNPFNAHTDLRMEEIVARVSRKL